MDFLIALQTHSLGNSQDTYKPYDSFEFKRYGCDDKQEVMKRCTRSLIKSWSKIIDAAKHLLKSLT